MKKALLFSAAMLFAVAGFAQSAQVSVDKNVKMTLPRPLKMENGLKTVAKRNIKKAPARSVTTGTYFRHPEGTFYVGWGLNGYGSILTQLAAPMNTDVTFKNLSSKANFKWAGSTVANAGEDYVYNSQYGFSQWAPVLINQKDSFCVGTNNIYSMGVKDGDTRFSSYSSLAYALNWGQVGAQDEAVLYPVDDHAGEYYNNRLYSNSASLAGFTSTNYLFGNGNMVNSQTGEVTGTITGASQYFGKTIAPLCVNAISFKGFSKTKPLAEGTVLTAYICGVQDGSFSDGTTFKEADPNNIIATLTCTSSDTIDFATPEAIGDYFTAAEGALRFTNKVTDDFGGVEEEPVIIPAGTEFCIYVAGFDQAGVDFGGFGITAPAEEELSNSVDYNGLIYYTLASDPTQSTLTCLTKPTAAQIGIVGFYDGAVAPTQPGFYNFENPNLNYNVVRVTGSGKDTETLTDGANGNALETQGACDGYPFVMVYTARDFSSDGETTNYTIESDADWLTVSYGVVDDDYNAYGLTFEAQPLPAGVTGRVAEVKVVGEGVESNTIYVLQGDATLGINNATAADKTAKNSQMFNIGGQKVEKSFKGLVIKNGKKFINK